MITEKIAKDGLEFTYDGIEDIMYIHIKRNSYSHSEDINGMLLDFNGKNELLGIEIPRFTSMVRVSKNQMKNLILGHVILEITERTVKLTVKVSFKSGNEKKVEGKYPNKPKLTPQRVHMPLSVTSS